MRAVLSRLVFVLSLVALVAPFSSQLAYAGDSDDDGGAAEAPAAGLSVTEIAFSLALKDRQPEERATSFKIGEKIYGWAELSNLGSETSIEMVWKRDGQENWRTTLTVGNGKTWRTWSKKKFRKGDAGSWTVEVVSGGQVLKSANFTVTE